jgi:hypothetical protein
MASPGSGPAHPFAWPTGSRQRPLSGEEFNSACDSWPRTAWSWSFTAWDCGTDRTRRNLLTPRVRLAPSHTSRLSHQLMLVPRSTAGSGRARAARGAPRSKSSRSVFKSCCVTTITVWPGCVCQPVPPPGCQTSLFTYSMASRRLGAPRGTRSIRPLIYSSTSSAASSLFPSSVTIVPGATLSTMYLLPPSRTMTLLL